MPQILTGDAWGCDVQIKRPVIPKSCRQSSPAENVVPTVPQVVPEVVPVAPGSGPSFDWNWDFLPDLPAPPAACRTRKQRRFAERAEDTLSGISDEGTPEEDIIGGDEIAGIMVAQTGGESESQDTASSDCSSSL